MRAGPKLAGLELGLLRLPLVARLVCVAGWTCCSSNSLCETARSPLQDNYDTFARVLSNPETRSRCTRPPKLFWFLIEIIASYSRGLPPAGGAQVSS